MRRRRLRCIPAALVLAAAFAACFTDVGNPDEETGMLARVRVDATQAADDGNPALGSVQVAAMGLRLLEAAWRDADSATHALWPSEAGRLLDFTTGDSLPFARLEGPPHVVALRLGRSPQRPVLAGRFELAGQTRHFRFEIPDTLEFALAYDAAILEQWRDGPRYHCSFAFLPRAWLSVPGLDTATLSPDSAGHPVAEFGATRNPDLHRALAQRLTHAFNGPRAYPKRAQP